jgi:thiol-disulfide isomerase/thioredoxin
MLKKALLLITGLSMTIACNSNGGNKPGTNITVNSTEPTEEMTLTALNPAGQEVIDSLSAVNGAADFSLTEDSGNFYMVTLKGSQINVPLFVMPDDDIIITTSKDTLTGKVDYTVTGSVESERIKAINDVVANSTSRLDSLAGELQGPDGQLDRAAFQQYYNEEIEVARAKLLAMVDEKPGSIANLFVWPQSLGNQQLVTATDHFSYYEKVGDAFLVSYPNLSHATFFAKTQLPKIKEGVERSQKLEQAQKNIALGMEAPNIQLRDSEGKMRELTELRGKVVLIDFWAAWCRPCRAENPTLVKTYNEYRDQGFTVFSVSLDGLPQQPNPKEAWLGAIQQDGLTWDNHVSDLQGWNSPVVDSYGFQGIPFTVLIDENGIILGKNLRGAALGQKLSKVFAAK